MSDVPSLSYAQPGTPAPGLYYKHSGQVTPTGLIVGGAVGVLAAVAMAVVYAWAVQTLPYLKLRVLCVMFFGMGMGFVPAKVMYNWKVRNLAVAMVVIGGVALIGWYASWVAWEAILLQGAPSHLPVAARIVRPDAVVSLAVRINAVGTWGEKHSYDTGEPAMTKGAMLAVIWAAEALTLLVASLMVGRHVLKNKPFCDQCNAWCSGPRTVKVIDPVDARQLRERLETGDFDAVARLPAPPRSRSETMDFTVFKCYRCGQLATLSVVRRKKTSRSNQAKTVIDKLRVTDDDLTRLTGEVPTQG